MAGGARSWRRPIRAAELEHLKIYLAMRKRATELVGQGVISFTGEFIEGTCDPNRGTLMVIRHVDGGYFRIRPDSRPKSDAVPKYFPPPTGSAAEHARDE